MANLRVARFQKVIGVIGRVRRNLVVNLLSENFFTAFAFKVRAFFGYGMISARHAVRQVLEIIIFQNEAVGKGYAANFYSNVGSSGGF